MEDDIKHMAHHDALTGLPNRRLFRDIIGLELAQARRNRKKFAILFLDLDRFKEINDALGHSIGDRLLKEVSVRFRESIRKSDTVARIGGDEFNIVLADLARSEDAREIASKIVKSLREPIVVDGHELHITTSVGISVYPEDSEEIDSLLQFADMAMYHAKESGRNTFTFYNPSINVSSLERMKLENWLRQTIRRGELFVQYQPQVEIRSRRIAYAEALVRWNHPDRGPLPPQEFIPLAEETGFITDIDEWVLRTVCAQARSWKDAGLYSFCVTVNLSARQFQCPDLVGRISAILRETGMEPGCLNIEVTETTAMSNIERTASQLRELSGMGVHISIDDFGTGYSSLNYLKKLPIERLKIDKSFIRDIAKSPDDRAIIGAVTSMARKMGIKTVAEGVETEEQLEFLRSSGCDEAQGFLFSPPLPPEEFSELVKSRRTG
jgi:diguanylate cyclase (GGDEF)-like protein